MLPDFLKDSYKQYKDDTDRFATWLVNAAKECGYQSADLPPARTLKREGKKTATSQPPEYKVTIGEMRKLCRAISDSAFKVPLSVVTAARRAIASRKRVTSWFLGQGSDASTQKHAHFIEILEELLEMLEWETVGGDASGPSYKGKGKTGPTEEPDADAGAQAWLNRFEALNVEEPDEWTSTLPSSTKVTKAAVVEEDSGNPDDYFSRTIFRVYCLFHDLHKWREFVSQTWAEYASFKIDLMTATVVTDKVLQFARDLIQEALTEIPSWLPADGTRLQEAMYTVAAAASGADMLPSTHLGLPFSVELNDVVEWTYLSTGILLNSFVPIIQSHSVPVYKPGYYGTYEPNADRTKMSVAERFTEDKILVLELLPEFAVMHTLKVPLPAFDEVTAGFIEFIRSKKSSLWLSFAVRIMLDAHNALRYSRLGAFGDLRMCSLRIAKTIDEHWKLSSTHPPPQFWPKESDDEIRRIREAIETFVENDPFKVVSDAADSSLGRHSDKRQPHLIFSRNPLLSGAFMIHLTLRFQTIGQALVTQWYDVQQLAFLYNLVQKAPGQTLVWPDIELFIKIHGESHIFIGDRPKDATQSLNRLEIVTGISSVSRFASNSRRRGKEWHRPDGKKARLLEPTTTVANLFRTHYQETASKMPRPWVSHGADMGRLLDQLLLEPTTATKSKDASEKQLKPYVAQDLLARKWRNRHKIGTLQLLALLKTKLCDEEPVLTFNYFAMHKRCIEMLRLIRDKEHDKFVQYFTPHYLPDDSMISNLVILVHHVARGSARAGAVMGLGAGAGSEVVSRIVVSCGDVMRGYLETNGDAGCRELRTFCKNKTPLVVEDGRNVDVKKEAEERFLHWLSLEEVLGPVEIEALKTGISPSF